MTVFTTFPATEFSAADVLNWYRTRWQVELVFKRFKSLAELGHLPKHDEHSARAWLYGKLFVALLARKNSSATPAPFPPGDITWSRRRPPSAWRDFQFMLNQVKRSIEPSLSLSQTFSQWNTILRTACRRTPEAQALPR